MREMAKAVNQGEGYQIVKGLKVVSEAQTVILPLLFGSVKRKRGRLYLKKNFFLNFWLHCAAHGILVPQPRIQPLSSRPPSIFPNGPSASYWWNQISFLDLAAKESGKYRF